LKAPHRGLCRRCEGMAGGGGFGRLRRFLLTWLPVGMLATAVVDNLRRADGLPDFRIYRRAGEH
jgi:hypothetical protein